MANINIFTSYSLFFWREETAKKIWKKNRLKKEID